MTVLNHTDCIRYFNIAYLAVFLKWAITGLFFFIFVFSIQLTVNVPYKYLPMTRFELWTSGSEAIALPTEPQSLAMIP